MLPTGAGFTGAVCINNGSPTGKLNKWSFRLALLVVWLTSLRLFSLVKVLPRIVSVHPGCSLGPLHWRPAAVPASSPCDSTMACVFDDSASDVVVAVETTARHPLMLKLSLPYYPEKKWPAFLLSSHVPPDDCSPGRNPTVSLMLSTLSFCASFSGSILTHGLQLVIPLVISGSLFSGYFIG